MSFLESVNEADQTRIIKGIARMRRQDPAQSIAQEILPKMLDYSPRFIKGAFDEDERELRLFRNSIQYFEKLFPDPRDRCSEKDLELWLRDNYKAENTNDPWSSIYAVLHTDDDVFGLAYLSLHLDSPWAYVSYLGILQGWRTLDRANKFIKDIDKHIQTILPSLKGVVFEIDQIDFSYLKDLSELSSVLDRNDFDEKALSNLRSLKRLKLFQHYESSVVLGRDGLPLPVWQPPLTKSLDATDEKELEAVLKFTPVVSVTAESYCSESWLHCSPFTPRHRDYAAGHCPTTQRCVPPSSGASRRETPGRCARPLPRLSCASAASRGPRRTATAPHTLPRPRFSGGG